MSAPCPGTCNSRYHKAWAEYRAALAAYDPLDSATSRPEEPRLTAREHGSPVWCEECTTRIRLALATLDDLAALWYQAADGHRTAPVTQRIGGMTVVASPSEIRDSLDDLTRALAAWEDEYRRLRNWPAAPPRGDDAPVPTTQIAWLSSHLKEILASALAEAFGKAILSMHPQVAASAKAGQRTIRLEARCTGHGCGQRLLFWEEGTDRVECRNADCGRITTKAEYDAESEYQAQRHRELFHRGRECNCAPRGVSRAAALY
jgi:hypothetical protein